MARVVAFKVSEEFLEMIDLVVSRVPGITRSDLIRAALIRFLEGVEND